MSASTAGVHVKREKNSLVGDAPQSLASWSSSKVPPFLARPEYIYNPSQIARRIWRQLDKGDVLEEVMLPWGAPLLIAPDETIGRAVWRTGVFDLTVVEALLRLADTGELVLDVGANIGFMTSALAYAVGSTGQVVSFEPHPGLVPKLRQNVNLWRSRLGWNHVTVSPIALSNQEGEATLTMPSGFARNQGIATLEADQGGEKVKVRTRTLNASLSTDETVGVMKLDVEGHEHSVLTGSIDLLSKGLIRDIVFEEHNKYPTIVTQLLESHGYQVFGMRKGIFGPQLTLGTDAKFSLTGGESPNYLATRDAFRASQRLGSLGWHALKRK
jgi:FkbM family methyltransferase